MAKYENNIFLYSSTTNNNNFITHRDDNDKLKEDLFSITDFFFTSFANRHIATPSKLKNMLLSISVIYQCVISSLGVAITQLKASISRSNIDIEEENERLKEISGTLNNPDFYKTITL